MRGNLITLTVGGYLYEQVGILNGINYSIPMESPWEIGISENNTIDESGLNSDKSVKELPMIIKVSGFNFTPIHDFVPSIQKNKYGKDNVSKVSTFGNQRYIALADGKNSTTNNNYDS